MQELSITTIQIIADLKLLFFIYLALQIFAIAKKARPSVHLALITTAVTGFYILLSWHLRKMWWANNGDEVFIFAFLTKVLHGEPFRDFFYDWLPPFYPPLYFWVTGLVASLVTTSGIVAAKIGTTLTLLAWFVAPYAVQKIYWNSISQKAKEEHSIIKTQWFWLLSPVVFLLLLDFDSIITKPYETLPALLVVILAGLIAESFKESKWTKREYIFFGLIGGLLFLEYYFWWFIVIPAVFLFASTQENALLNTKRSIYLGIIIFIFSLPYLGPFIGSFFKYGIENWQAIFFVPQDFSTFAPWSGGDLLLTALLILGLGGLIFGSTKERFLKSVLFIFAFTYIYQFFNIAKFLLGTSPFQSSKPFLFLGTACLAIGTSYALVQGYKKYISRLESKTQTAFVITLFLVFIALTPFIRFANDPVVWRQIEIDLEENDAYWFSERIKEDMPDYETRTWLSSGNPELSAYLPISYYIAYNPHFSNQAAQYARRFEEVEQMTTAKTPEDFMRIIEKGFPRQVDGLMLYYDDTSSTYPLFFWRDNYPNGGSEQRFDLPARLISDKYWKQVVEYGNWKVFIRK